jgi:hypothetical protein
MYILNTLAADDPQAVQNTANAHQTVGDNKELIKCRGLAYYAEHVELRRCGSTSGGA